MDGNGSKTLLYVLLGGGAAAMLSLLLLPAVLLADSSDATAGLGPVDAGAIPAEYRDAVLAAGERCETVSASVLAAQIEAESNWNPKATSPVGAQGISQFMPGTWATWGKDYSGDGQADVTNPADAIGSQADYMCSLAAQVRQKLGTGILQGDPLELTLAAYNAGLGNVVKYKGVPPFPETTAYVKKIRDSARTKYSQEQISPGGGGDGGPVALPVAAGRYVNQNNFGRSGSLWARQHTGVDFSAPCGTPVRAATSGILVRDLSQSGWAGPNFAKIETGRTSTATWYAHMTRLAARDGQRVRAGEVIGYVGSLGNSTGCHLHFEVHPKNGGYAQDEIDPNPWLRSKGLRP